MFRMTVEDVFVIRNRGVVATGRVEGGTLRVGDTVQINGTPRVLFKKIEKSQVDRGSVLTAAREFRPIGEMSFVV
jgi:elongation factor Tu